MRVRFKASVFQNHCNLLSAQYLMLHYHIKQGTSVKPITEHDGILLLNSLNIGEGGSSWTSVCFTGCICQRLILRGEGNENNMQFICLPIWTGCRGIYFIVGDSQSHFPNNRRAFFLNYNLLIFHPFSLSFILLLWAGLASFYLLTS